MPAERVCMRRVREILRLKFAANVSIREIARRVGTAPSTVRAALERFQAAALAWPLPDQVTDSELEAAAFELVLNRITASARRAFFSASPHRIPSHSCQSAGTPNNSRDAVSQRDMILRAIAPVMRPAPPTRFAFAITSAHRQGRPREGEHAVRGLG